jgi:hypothetical protein
LPWAGIYYKWIRRWGEYCLVLQAECQMTLCAIGQEAVAAGENLLEVVAVLKFSGQIGEGLKH